MPTWADYKNNADVAYRRRQQDAALRDFTAVMDLAAQDRHAKFERPQFAVVGEGSRSAQDRYRAGYEGIRWK